MSDPASTARTARESLSRGLQALQADPTVPPHLLDLAASIAQSMGALHQIERTNGAQLLPHAAVALENVRKVLSQLQGLHGAHPAVNVATESVASSLSLVHSLNQLASAPAATAPLAAAPPPPAPPVPPSAPQHAAPIPLVQQISSSHQAIRPPSAPHAAAPPYQGAAAYAPTAAAFPQAAPGALGVGAPAFPPPAQAYAPPPAQAYAPPPPAQAYAPPPAQAYAPPPAPAPVYAQVFQPPSQPLQQPAPAYEPPAPARSPSPAPGDMPVVSADLGAHSASNFYKGLSGNDIIDHGGLFVSTYMIPKIGTPVRIKVSLPGGYEFEANGIVRWAREQSDGSDAPPGFGAQFTQITTEARQLVYRYVRNREPLFHDDL